MLKLIFSLDYEIHGNGDGDPLKLMVEPTWRLMSLMEKFGCKLTIFAEMAEISKFRDYSIEHNEDKFHFTEIKEQLQHAILNGHDVQLHIHSSWFNSEFRNGKWQQSWEEYDFASLEYKKIFKWIRECKVLLESIIRERVPDYVCHVFRAANWAMQPTKNIARALAENSIFIDSSVYKYGEQHEWVNYDYSKVFDGSFPYRASSEEIGDHDPDSLLWEFPIYCESHPIHDFISPVRFFRMLRAKFHKHDENIIQTIKDASKKHIEKGNKNVNRGMYPRKFDFNQLTGGQMIRQINRISIDPQKLPIITLIGHSKSFIRYNYYTLRRFLKFISTHKTRYSFSLFPAADELQD